MSPGLVRRSCDCLETNSFCKFLHPASIEPFVQVLALTDIKCTELVAPIYNGLNTNSGHSDTASD